MRLAPFMDGFADELTKIASFGIGAAMGGAMGVASGGKTLKSRAIRGAAGALVGGTLTGTAGAAKKALGNNANQEAAAGMRPWEPDGYTPSWAGGPAR